MYPATLTLFGICLVCIVVPTTTVLAASSNSTTTPGTNEQCGNNEEYSQCVTCQRTCRDILNINCNETQCHPACTCRLGYFRNNEGECVTLIGCLLGALTGQ